MLDEYASNSFSVPIASVALGFALVGFPHGFPFHGQADRKPRSMKQLLTTAIGSRLDLLGAALLLFAILSMTAGFEEADQTFPWKSPFVIVMLVLSGLLWSGLLLWERHITLKNGVREPLLPWTFLTNRVMIGVLSYVFTL